jgi:hypothetical protein
MRIALMPAASLPPLVQSDTWKEFGGRSVASFQVIGSSSVDEEVWLFAHESLATFYIAGGRLIESGGMSVPVRVRLDAGDLRPLSIDMPSDGSEYAPSLKRLMPNWAVERLFEVERDAQALRDAAGLWAKRSGLLPGLVAVAPPDHADPHNHQPDVYTLPAIPPDIHGFTVNIVERPRSTTDRDLEWISKSRDGRFECFFNLGSGAVLVIHDRHSSRRLQVAGPGLDVTIENVQWVGDTIVFDKVDVGFGEPRPEQMTMVHVEINLEELSVVRVVPFGPYTSNSH